jgi:hypothetical protein
MAHLERAEWSGDYFRLWCICGGTMRVARALKPTEFGVFGMEVECTKCKGTEKVKVATIGG